MVHFFVRHAVENYDRWKSYFDEHGPTPEDGVTGGRVFRASDDPRDVVVLTEWKSMEALRAWLESDDTDEAIAESGVVGEPESLFLEAESTVLCGDGANASHDD